MGQTDARRKIAVSFLGGFRLESDGNILTDEINRSQKLWNVLSYLILNKDRHITQSEFIDLFWPSDNSANPASALKTLLYRIRAMLESFFGEDVSPIMSQRGSYSWNPNILCELDIDHFAAHIEQAKSHHLSIDLQIDHLRNAITLYKGDFLPALADQLWVVPISARYHMMYLDAVKSLAKLLQKKNCFTEISELCVRASELDPLDEELHVLIVRSFILQGKDAAALSHYEKATDLLYRNLGVRPSQELRSLHAEIMKIDRELESDLEVVQRDLMETSNREGAFICDYGFFREGYRLEARRFVRNGICIHIVLLTVSLPNGGVPPLKVLNNAMDTLLDALMSTLRRGDVITKYSGAQYLVLLRGANFEDSSMVIERVLNLYNRKNRTGFLKVSYKIRELESG